MKYLHGCLSFCICSLVHAGGQDLIRQVEEIEYLLTHLNKQSTQAVIHHYYHLAQAHDYFIGCLVEDAGAQHVGLVSHSRKKCFIRQGKKLKAKDKFSYWIKNDRELREKAESIVKISSEMNSKGSWGVRHEFYITGVPCLHFTLNKPEGSRKFCLHSEAVAASDYKNKTLYYWGAIISGTLMIIAPALVLLLPSAYSS